MNSSAVGLRSNDSVTQLARKVLPKPVRRGLVTAVKEVGLLGNRGHEVECPCCGRSFRRFQPHGRAVEQFSRWRPYACCQNCGALERHRTIWLFIQEQTDLLTAPYRFLHSAPEPQFRRHFSKAPKLDYVTVDIDPRQGDLQVDLTHLPMEDASFDVLMCNHVLEHIIDDRKAMSELYRVLKPGGWAIITVPQDFDRETTFEDPSVVSPEERLQVFGQEDHVRIYGTDFTSRLSEAGFKIEAVKYDEQVPEEQRRRFGLTADGLIYRCTK